MIFAAFLIAVLGINFVHFLIVFFVQCSTIFRNLKARAEPILGSVTWFGRVSDTRQYSVLGRHKPADTEY